MPGRCVNQELTAVTIWAIKEVIKRLVLDVEPDDRTPRTLGLVYPSVFLVAHVSHFGPHALYERGELERFSQRPTPIF